jgi:hypothetical protein
MGLVDDAYNARGGPSGAILANRAKSAHTILVDTRTDDFAAPPDFGGGFRPLSRNNANSTACLTMAG